MIEIELTREILDDLKKGKSFTSKYDVIIYNKYDQEIETEIEVTIFLEKKITQQHEEQQKCFHDWEEPKRNKVVCKTCGKTEEMH